MTPGCLTTTKRGLLSIFNSDPARNFVVKILPCFPSEEWLLMLKHCVSCGCQLIHLCLGRTITTVLNCWSGCYQQLLRRWLYTIDISCQHFIKDDSGPKKPAADTLSNEHNVEPALTSEKCSKAKQKAAIYEALSLHFIPSYRLCIISYHWLASSELLPYLHLEKTKHRDDRHQQHHYMGRPSTKLNKNNPVNQKSYLLQRRKSLSLSYSIEWILCSKNSQDRRYPSISKPRLFRITPTSKMEPGDWLIYPTTEIQGRNSTI